MTKITLTQHNWQRYTLLHYQNHAHTRLLFAWHARSEICAHMVEYTELVYMYNAI